MDAGWPQLTRLISAEKIEEIRKNPEAGDSVTLTTLATIKSKQEKKQAKEDGTADGDDADSDGEMELDADSTVSKVRNCNLLFALARAHSHLGHFTVTARKGPQVAPVQAHDWLSQARY